LTITLGVSRALIQSLGLPVPEVLPEIPEFSTDALDARWRQTDLMIQIGSDDPLTLSHAQRMVTKDLSTLTTVQWIQSGFVSPIPGTPGGSASRNLMGQVDGTVNPDINDFNEVVWINDSGWADGGTVLILRRIRMLMDEWDQLERPAKEIAVGRTLETGAPLGGASESDPVDLQALDPNGLPVIPRDAHVRIAHANSAEESILRRPYNYDEGIVDGKAEMGLIFAAYTKNPTKSFIPMQQRLAESDAMNRWLTTIGSAAYVILPGVAEGEVLGQEFI
jgi:dye decolorizing peroxidase